MSFHEGNKEVVTLFFRQQDLRDVATFGGIHDCPNEFPWRCRNKRLPEADVPSSFRLKHDIQHRWSLQPIFNIGNSWARQIGTEFPKSVPQLGKNGFNIAVKANCHDASHVAGERCSEWQQFRVIIIAIFPLLQDD